MAETTLAGLAHHGEALHARVEQAVQQQLAGLSEGFERSRVATEASWAKVVSEQTQAQQALVSDLRQHLQAFSNGQGAHAEALSRVSASACRPMPAAMPRHGAPPPNSSRH